MMEHTEAVETMAAERYALDELPPEERDAFEDHYFDCVECATAVRDIAVVAAGTRSLGAKSVAAPHSPWWAIAAAAAFAAVIGYQNFVTIPQLRSPGTPQAARVVHPVLFLTAGSRAGETIEIVVAKDEDVSMYVDVPPEPPWPSYVIEIHDKSEKVRATVHVSAEEARESVLITVPGGTLTPGRYELVISGSTAEKHETIARYPFNVRYR